MPRAASKKKELHLGKCLGDLHTLSEIKPLDNNVSIIIRSLNKVFQDAENFDSQGDEERAYVMYMKYFNILTQIRTKADYKSRKDYFEKLIGKKNQSHSIDRAEELSQSLKERYDLKQAEALAKKFASLESSSTSSEKKEFTVEVETKVEIEPQVVVSPKTPSGVIKCISLCELLRDVNTKLILMDVRPRADFIKSHISHTDCVSIPEEVLTPGSTVNHIQSKLPEESSAVWLQRKNADHIILLDWKSTLKTAVIGSPLRTLKDALFKFDISTIIKSEPLILEGGYEQWLLFYPTMTTNAHVARPSDMNLVHPPSPTMTLDFDYPDLDESLPTNAAASSDTRSDQPTPSINNSVITAAATVAAATPQFDRNLKPSQSVDNLSSLNASKGSEVFSSLNNVDATNTQQRGQTAALANNNLYPTVLAGTKIADKNTNILNDKVANIPKTNNLSFKNNNLAADFSKSVTHREEKEAELKEFQRSRDNALKEDQQRIKEVEKRLNDLMLIKKKEEKDVADLMRMKKRLMEDLEKEKQRQEGENQQFAAEETRRLLALEQARREEEEKKRRFEEVDRMRLDRKKEEQLKEIAKMQLEEQRKKDEEKAILMKLEEDRRVERIKAAIAKQEEEEEAERLRRTLQENIEKEEAEKELLRQQHELEQQRKAVEETKRKFKEQEEIARQEEEIRKKEQMEKEMKEKEQLEKDIKQKEQIERELEKQRNEALVKRNMEEAARKQAQRDKEAKEKLQATEPQASKTVPSNMLPSGWEKRLDRATNRYFYIDHNHGTTQWTSPAAPVLPETYTARLKDEPSVSSSRGLSRSHSSPNIKKQLEEEEEQARKAMPNVDRSSKPSFRTMVPVPKQTAYVVRKRDLNPIYGNVGPALTGLRNLGNTCYMNSTIQCLNNTSPLITYFLNDSYLHDINRENSQGMHGDVVDDFAIVVKALWSQQYRSITPRDLKNTVGKYNPMFSGYQQQDSQEFLTFLLDGLHEGLNEVVKVPDIPEQNNDNVPDDVAAPLAWNHHKLLHKSVIVELFQGQLKSTLMCRTCKKTSVTFQAFMFLSLPIPASSRCSLKECIQEFLKPEMMTGSSKWKCPRCKVERDSEKKIDIWKLPPILMIGLLRFYSEGMWIQKKTTYVDFPIDDLDFSPYMIGPIHRNRYSLYGISNHYGTMEGGHYTAFCRNPVIKKWFKFDDHDVYEMSSSDVKTSAAYVLYYTSMDMPAPQYKPHL